MSQSPSAALLRLREADVVRFCGLTAAARGLEMTAQHAVTHGQRLAARLEARVTDDAPTERAQQPEYITELTWVEVVGIDPPTIRWHCACQKTAAHPSSSALACEHVAAILTAWIRDPLSFADATSNDSGIATIADKSAIVDETALKSQKPPGAHIAQPPLLKTPRLAPPHGETTLAEELERRSAADLLAITRRVLGLEDTSPDARKLLELHVRDSQKLIELVERLDSEAQILLAELLLLGGTCTTADLDAIADRSGEARSALRATISVLERHALIFPVMGRISTTSTGQHTPAMQLPSHLQAHPWRQVAGWHIPAEIRHAWSPSLPVSSVPTRTTHGPPLLAVTPNDKEPSPRTAKVARVMFSSPRQLSLALALLAYAPPPYNLVQNTSAPAARIVSSSAPQQKRQFAQFTQGPPFPLVPGDLSFHAATEFARGAGVPVGLVQMARRVLLWGREQGIVSLLLALPRLSVAEHVQALKSAFSLWQQAEVPFELADLTLPGSCIQARFDQRHEALRPAAVASDVYEARKFLLATLRHAKTASWYSLDALLELLWRINPYFLRGRQNTYTTPSWWLERADRGHPLRTTVREEWYAAEGEYLRLWLSGPLHWWGALDLATNDSGRPIAFRLTPLGAYLLARGETPPPAGAFLFEHDWGAPVISTREGALAVQPLAAGAPLLDALAAWARPTAISGGRIIFTFDANLASAAFDQKRTPDHLLALLYKADPSTGQRTLTSAQGQFAAWAANYGAARITSGWTLIEAQDEVTLSEALAPMPELANHCQRLSPAQMLAPPEIVDELIAALQRRGYHV